MTPNVDYKTRRDQVVARRLQNTFERDLELASVQGLNFFVQDGVVTLYGTIRHELDRELISSVVRSVPGVREVVEHVSVARPDQGSPQPE
jgi:osmotically-inducible protein OsmY